MATTLTTIDVSKRQDPEKIDWDGLKKRGLKSIIIQLSHGSSYEPNAKEFIAKAKSLGLKIHGYHFYEGSLSEIAFSYQNAEKLGLDKGAYMFLDMEGSISGDWQTQFYSFRSAWLQAGFHVGLYISESPYKAKFDNTKLVNDGVYRWIADYSHEPANYDIWQYSSSNGTLDVSYDRAGKLEQNYQLHTVYPVKPDSNKNKSEITFEPGPHNPTTPKDGSWVGWGVDSSGLGGGVTFGYSTDGKNFYAAIWPGGFVFRQNDADQMFDLMKAHITTLTTNSKVAWANVLDKPDVALKSDIPKMPDLSSYALKADIPKAVDLTGYAKLADIPSVTGFLKQADLVDYAKKIDIPSLDGYAKTSDIPKSMAWNQITDKPSLALTSDIPSLDGYAKLTDIPSVTGLVKEAELDDYAKKTDLPVIPDLTPYAKLTDLNKYALAMQIPTTMAWDSITNKPTLALKSDIPSLTGYAKLTDIPSVSGLVKETELADYAKKSDLPTTMAWQNITNKPDVATQDELKKIELMPGPKGNPGADGKDGVTPHIDNATGDWFIGNQDTGIKAQGLAGKDGQNGRDGADGQPGKDGQNGITPHIDTATGNWFVGSTDTGIKAQGPQGIQGVPGKDGRNGIDGKDGDRGPQGIPGEQGEPGVPGTNGKDGKSAYQIWLDNGHSGTETDFLNSLKGKDGTDVDLSGYATTEAVQKAQSTADNAYKYSQNEASLINKRIDNIKVPTESDFNRVKTITSGTLAGLASAQGSYHYEIDFVPSDGPASDWGLLDVVVGEHYAKQVFTNTGATGDNLGNVYIRTRGYGSTSWSDWREITLWQ